MTKLFDIYTVLENGITINIYDYNFYHIHTYTSKDIIPEPLMNEEVDVVEIDNCNEVSIYLSSIVRACSECGKVIISGYCVNDGYEYYCSDECLHEHYTDEEYQEMYEDDAAYWTDWENEFC